MIAARPVPSPRVRAFLGGLLAAALLFAPSARPAYAYENTGATAVAPLQFRITEGRIENAFHQEGDIAAHLLLSSGERPRVLVAFPAGNSGVGVWFEDVPAPVRWTLGEVAGKREDVRGRPWNGIEATASVDAARLVVRDAVLGSVRVLRDYQLGEGYPPETAARPQVSAHAVRWRRDRLDGAPGYAIALHADNGRFRRESGKLVLRPDRAGEPLRLRIEATTGETPLTPFADLLNERTRPDPRSRQALQFLSYREKFLAGSWRFDTYFGRDTLMSLRLLMPVLQPAAVDAGIASVLARLSPGGEVAHEEDIGEFAVLRHRKEQGTSSAAPIYDYAMIDDDYMLPPVAAAWLLDDPRGRAGAAAFLAAGEPGQRHGDALVRNLLFVAASSEAFAREPVYTHLLALQPGRQVGQWRDSNEGLGRGRYPYDVNAVWMPAALRAIGAFLDNGLLDDYATPEQRAQLRAAAARAGVWEREAAALFAVSLPPAQAAAQVRAYAAHAGVDTAPALASLGAAPLAFPAIALDAQGRPVPVLHSDEGFRLLFGRPDAASLDRDVAAMMRPFPAGLMTDVGLLVANPAYAGQDAWPRFGNSAYHGTVVWAWQQAVLAAGLQRQLARDDLPAATRDRLRQAQARLWQAIRATDEVRTSELWSWSYADGRYRLEPFGAQGAHEDESNAAQLWSTVYLAVDEP
ncbi:hypothetical protein [Pseudoxanthomonas putridarboris]|uniref:Glycogen debranching enzyme n=1 Tax=Pseudoxanthomonas putridarboris TaxID=752605 RepID=A0ABU9J2C2_9GAMM